jgi:lipopolysaccharide export system protein LptA
MLRFFMTGLAGAILALGLAASAAAQVNIGFGGVAYDSRQPVEVTADNLTIDQATGEAVFSGNVIVHQGDLRMAAGRVRVLYSETDGRRAVDQVVASGGVLVTRGADAAEGSEARFDVASALLTMAGQRSGDAGPDRCRRGPHGGEHAHRKRVGRRPRAHRSRHGRQTNEAANPFSVTEGPRAAFGSRNCAKATSAARSSATCRWS